MHHQEGTEQRAPSTSSAPTAWSFEPRTLLMIGAAVLGLLGLLALAASVDLSNFGTSDTDEASGASGASSDGWSVRPGFDGSLGIEHGDGDRIEARPIPGCPGGLRLGDNVLLVPDPEACGFRPMAPGERAISPSGQIILTPSVGGNVGGLRLGPDGQLEAVAPGDVREGDLRISILPNGSFGFEGADGSIVELTPGSNGLESRQRASEDTDEDSPDSSRFDGQDGVGNQTQDRDSSTQRSLSALKVPLFILGALVLFGFVAYVLRDLRRRPTDQSGEDVAEETAVVESNAVDYSTQISTLDRLLWEIEQEGDPRTAIRRVYGVLETGLGNNEMRRHASETPGRYLERILGQFDDLGPQLQELTHLFELARYSDHTITGAMRERAITLLRDVRARYATAAVVSHDVVVGAP